MTEAWREVANLVESCLRPPRTDRQRPLPIILIWGPAQSGKSALLTSLEQSSGHRPFARRDGTTLGLRRPYEVALLLAFHLGRRVEGFGRLKFPRLLLGVAMLRVPVTIDDPDATREAIIRRTVPNRRHLMGLLRAVAPDLISLVGAERGAQRLLGVALEGILAIVETAPLLGGRGTKWYGDGRLGARLVDPVDALVALAEWEADQQTQSSVDEVLCRAFLADLRDGCSPRLHWHERDENCLVLLDNADSEGARRFLDILAAQRQDWDPLLVVAAASTRAPTADHHHPERWVTQKTAQASYQDWKIGRNTNHGWVTLYPLSLDGMTDDEAEKYLEGYGRLRASGVDIAGILRGRDQVRQPADEPHERIHVGGMRVVLRAIDEAHEQGGGNDVDIRRLFELPGPDGAGSPLAEQVLGWLLGRWPPRLRAPLLRAAAARHFDESALAPVLEDEPGPIAQAIRSLWSRDLWVRHLDSPAPPTLHPLVRRAALHLLAAPTQDGDPTWAEVHQHLKRRAEQHGDTTTAMYHCLANGGVREVAEHLSTLFAERDTTVWYDDLTAITNAPVASPATGKNVEDHWGMLVAAAGGGNDGLIVPVRLVAAMQLHADPLADPHHALCTAIALELEHLARHSRNGFFFLLERAEEFRNCWEDWHNI